MAGAVVLHLEQAQAGKQGLVGGQPVGQAVGGRVEEVVVEG
jgi:hypothetical protein